MEKRIIDRKSLTFLGSGQNADCYLDKETGIVYKVFKNINTIDFNHFVTLKKYLVSGVNIPIELLEENNTLVGYTYKFMEGISLEEFILSNKKNISIEKLIEYYNKFIETIKHISKNNVVIGDIHLKNIIINEDGFSLIDIDDYTIQKNKNYDDIFNINKSEIDFTMLDFISFYGRTLFNCENTFTSEEFKQLIDNMWNDYREPEGDVIDIEKLIYGIQGKVGEPPQSSHKHGN